MKINMAPSDFVRFINLAKGSSIPLHLVPINLHTVPFGRAEFAVASSEMNTDIEIHLCNDGTWHAILNTEILPGDKQ